MIDTYPDEQMLASGFGKKVLIIEDDQAMSVALRDGFTYEGYEVIHAGDGLAGLEMAGSAAPDMVILDVMLPKLNGLDVCKRLRSNACHVPIIMLTARGQEIDKVLGLKLGADDYITKPFSMMELIARVESILRRLARVDDGPREELNIYQCADLYLDFKRHEARKGGKSLDLSPREYRLMEYFIEHRGQVVTREELLDSVWDFDGVPFTRTVDTHIAKLRKKIEDQPANPKLIVTVHRLGYKFLG